MLQNDAWDRQGGSNVSVTGSPNVLCLKAENFWERFFEPLKVDITCRSKSPTVNRLPPQMTINGDLSNTRKLITTIAIIVKETIPQSPESLRVNIFSSLKYNDLASFSWNCMHSFQTGAYVTYNSFRMVR